MPYSFRTKLTVWYSLVLSTLLAVSAGILYGTLENAAAQKLDATLWLIGSTEAESISARLRDRGLSDPDDLTVRDIDIADLVGYDVFRLQRYVTIVTQSHRVADFSVNLSAQPLPYNESFINQALQNGQINFQTVNIPNIGDLRLVYIPVAGRETKPFIVIVGIPTKFGTNELRGIALETIVIILVFMSLAVMSGWFLARWTMRPIRETAAAVRGIGERNLHERLPQPRTNDEIDNLVTVFNQLLSRLEQSFETQQRFTADASHEIGTPLTTLKGQTEVALLERRTPEQYESLLHSNLDEIERLSQITASLLVLARADAGEQQITPEILSLDVLVKRVFNRFRLTAESNEIDLSLVAETSVFVIGDETAIEQIVSNFLQNAVRYTLRAGSVCVIVALDEADRAVVTVKDSGIGIGEEDLPYVFERFYRARNARLRRSEGSGLGLSISQMLAESLGGKISVASETGKGSEFIFSLPALIYKQDEELE